MANPSIIVDFLANTAGLQRGIKEAQSSSGKFGSTLKTLGKTGAIAAGAAGVGALIYTLKTGFGEFEDSQKVAAQTAAVIKSTGEEAHVSAGHVSDLAGALLKKTGIDDEVITSGENLLLTFTNIRNEAGKGNDIFDQTTQIMTDLSVATGESMSTAAVQLGKALQDPIKGVGQLRRVGVDFTDAQKDQIATMEKSGDTMGAQKIILQELTKEFGGSAEAAGKTFSGQINVLRESFNNFAGDLVGKMIPVLTELMTWFTKNWPAIRDTVVKIFNQDLEPTFAALASIVKSIVDVFIDNWDKIGPVVKAAATVVGDMLKLIGDIIRPVAALLRGDWSEAWTDFQKLGSDAIKLLRDEVALEIKAIRLILDGLWDGIQTAAALAWSGVVKIVDAAVGKLTDTIGGIAGAILATAKSVANAVAQVASAIASPFVSAASTVSGAIDGIIGDVKGLASALEGAVGAVASAAGHIANAIRGPINAVIGAWNNLSFTVPTITIPGFEGVKVAGKTIVPGFGGTTIGGETFGFPNISGLAAGGVVDRPTLALVGEAGREIVTPEALLRSILAEQRPEVRVFIGDTELRGIVRAEVVTANNRTAQTLLAGVR